MMPSQEQFHLSIDVNEDEVVYKCFVYISKSIHKK